MKNLLLSILLLAAVAVSAQEAPHRFLDGYNKTLFVSAVVAQTYDAATTRYVLNNYPGSGERDVFARPFEKIGSAGTAAFHYGVMTGGPMLVSYWLHRKGHHRWERVPLAFSTGMGLQGGIHNSREIGK